MTVASFAPAKINLYLHVAAPRADGLHPLDSLVVFAADVGDWVSARAADALSLTVSGPFAATLADEPDNLVLRAARALATHAGVAPRAALQLEKHLPIASGIGGGSSDAAAALRVLNRLWKIGASDDDLRRLAASLGADVPACVRAQPVRMRGIGDELTPMTAPDFDAVLVNPRAPAPTRDVYRAFDAAAGNGAFADSGAATRDWLARQRNDLTDAAIQVAPAIADALSALRAAAPSALARLSGSGATCFALASDRAEAEATARNIAAAHPDWWVRTARLGAVDVAVVER